MFYFLSAWAITMTRREMKIKVISQGQWLECDAVGLISILDRGQFVMHTTCTLFNCSVAGARDIFDDVDSTGYRGCSCA